MIGMMLNFKSNLGAAACSPAFDHLSNAYRSLTRTLVKHESKVEIFDATMSKSLATSFRLSVS